MDAKTIVTYPIALLQLIPVAIVIIPVVIGPLNKLNPIFRAVRLFIYVNSPLIMLA